MHALQTLRVGQARILLLLDMFIFYVQKGFPKMEEHSVWVHHLKEDGTLFFSQAHHHMQLMGLLHIAFYSPEWF